MLPILYQSNNLIIGSYTTFFVLGWAIGGIVFYREFKRLGWPLETMLFVMAGCIVGAFLGAALFSLLFIDWSHLPEHFRLGDLIGRSVLGGIAGGFIGVEITKKLVGYPHSTGDAFAVAIPLGHAIGRIGCYLGGCCFGTPTDVPWAVTYPTGSVPHQFHLVRGWIEDVSHAPLSVHPAPLYELAFDFGLFLVLWRLRDRFAIRGTLFRLYLAMYASYRFIAEFYRGDSPFPDWGLKPVQYLLFAAAIFYGWKVIQQRGEQATS